MGWTSLSGKGLARFEDGKVVEIATPPNSLHEAKITTVQAVEGHLGRKLLVWGSWAMHPVDRRLYVRVLEVMDSEQ